MIRRLAICLMGLIMSLSAAMADDGRDVFVPAVVDGVAKFARYGEGVEAVSRFRSLKLKDKHMGLYCTGRFESCPVYGCTYDCKYRDI